MNQYHGIVVNRDSDDGEYDVNPLQLMSLTLQSNCLVGNFRKTFKYFFVTVGKHLRVLNLSRNELNYKKGLPKELSHCKVLTTLLLENTGGKGPMPDEAGILDLPSLQVLSLAGNQFEGSPEYIFQISQQLRVVNLSNNHFDGVIESAWLAPLKNTIETLDFSYNRFGGIFFTKEVCQLFGNTIKHLKLSGNNFVGSLPREIKQLKLLEVLHIDKNNFTGMIPYDFFKLTNMRRLWMEKNTLMGDIAEFKRMKNLRTLVIGENNFGEEVPDVLAKLKYLRVLRMNDNRFVGVFPMLLLVKMKCLREFDITGNKYMNGNSVKRAMEYCVEQNIQSKR